MAVRIELYEEVTIELMEKKLMTAVAVDCLRQECFLGDGELGIHFVDELHMQRLNRQHRGIDKTTDVLSFPLLNQDELKKNYDYPVLLGDVFICLPCARKQAALYGHSLQRELAFLCSHGVLHLLGHDHESEEQANAMFALQEIILQRVGLPRDNYV